MKNGIRFTIAILLACISSAWADVVILKRGQVISGTVLKNDEKGVLIQLDYGTLTYPKSLVKDVQVEKKSSDNLAEAEIAKRIPGWQSTVAILSKKTWAIPLRQVPAAVINRGILRNVPYISFQCGGGYEVNVYGDLDNPACVEIGLHSQLLTFEPAKTNCLEFMAAILPQQADKDIIKNLRLDQDLIGREGINFEVTHSTAQDTFRGWWLSVYDEAMLERARATKAELSEITQASNIAPTEPESPKPQIASQPLKTSSLITQSTNQYGWASSDFGTATPIRSYSSEGNNGGGGTVYVRGYTRRDGTYVRPHTRRSR